MTGSTRCPCGSGVAYADCCGPLHRGVRQAATAVELMRSRYAAFGIGDGDYLFRTWHPRTRPADVDPSGVSFERLEILETTGGGERDDAGEVEFVAHYRAGSQRGRLHERSRFARRAGRWFYLDGSVGG